MRHIRHAITQAFLLNKRILKQPVFLILLALVPMLVLGVNLISFETGSLVTVAVAPGSHDDSSARALISTLVHHPSPAVRYISCHDDEAVQKAVASGEARLGIVFPPVLDELFAAYGAQETADLDAGALAMLGSLFGSGSNSMKEHQIICYTATNDIVAKMTREQLFGKMYRDMETAVVKVWLRSHPEIGDFSDTQRDEFAEQIRMIPLPVNKEKAGYLLNSMLIPFLLSGLDLAANGISDPESIDKAWKLGTGAPRGPFEIFDVVGLTTAYNIVEKYQKVPGLINPLLKKMMLPYNFKAQKAMLKKYIDEGKLGRSSGEGFYKY